jgi:hypothetical protein
VFTRLIHPQEDHRPADGVTDLPRSFARARLSLAFTSNIIGLAHAAAPANQFVGIFLVQGIKKRACNGRTNGHANCRKK